MPKIIQLPPHEAQKIAAGEVIERPANIVKELLENAIDAQATHVSIYIEDAGKKLIRIIDNGCGMDKHDAQLCFDRHATSKITQVSDLETINTFGFRGEALASIAAISNITLTTAQENVLEGTQVVINGGTIENVNIVAASQGTDIAIADLFFNVPARKKFLKSTETEWRAIQQLFNAFCFDYPHICFSLFNNNKHVAHYPTTDSLKNRALQLWESTVNHHIIDIEKKDDQCSITGIITDHQTYRYDKNNIYFFVNNRWVKNYQLNNALIKGYANVIPEGRYPLAAIHIQVPAHVVDINIHPRKEEVKFLHPRSIEQTIQQAVKIALEQNISRHLKRDITFQAPPSPQYKPIQTHFTPFNFDSLFSSAHVDKNNQHDNNPLPIHKKIDFTQIEAVPRTQAITHQPLSISHEHAVKETNFRLIGQFQKTYILIEKQEGLFLVDQHAAHERILYEQFAHKLHNTATIPLLFPHIITLSNHDIQLIEPYFVLFATHGIMIEQCANDQLIIQSLPVYLKNESLESLIQDFLIWISEYKTLEKEDFIKTVNNKLQAQMACKAAVKAGDELSAEKMLQLLHDLEKTANRMTCPHGRPTSWLISLNDIEKKFKRKT